MSPPKIRSGCDPFSFSCAKQVTGDNSLSQYEASLPKWIRRPRYWIMTRSITAFSKKGSSIHYFDNKEVGRWRVLTQLEKFFRADSSFDASPKNEAIFLRSRAGKSGGEAANYPENGRTMGPPRPQNKHRFLAKEATWLSFVFPAGS